VSRDYDEMTQRNIGLLSVEEQERVRTLVVAVAGCGGVGGAAAHFLARLGVGEFRLADPETFERSNVNRQFAAYADTVGVNKAEAVADELRRINPALTVTSWTEGLGPEMVGAFLDGAGAVVDALDFWSLGTELLLHREAARRGLWIFTSQGAVEISTVTSFDPAAGALEDMVSDAEGPSMAAAIGSFMPVLPKAATPELLAGAIAGDRPDVPLDVVASSFEAAFLVNELVRVVVRSLPAHAVAPDLLVFDQDEVTVRRWDGAGRTWRP
jgi:hypothetical protein